MSKAFTAAFKLETAKLVLDQNYTQEEAAKAMNVSRSAIGLWVKSLRLERQGKTSPGLPLTSERIEFKALKKRIEPFEMENEILKKTPALLNIRLTQRFSVVDKLRAQYPIASLCQVFFHRSGYRQWHCRADEPDAERARRSLVKEA